MKFYRINENNVVNSRKTAYAYLTLNSDNYPKNYKELDCEDNFIYKCPYCNREKILYFRPSCHIAVFNKNKIGDFSYDGTSYGDVTISDNVINMFSKYNLKGIVDLKEYLFVETKKKERIDCKLYDAKLTYLPYYWKYVVDDMDSFTKPQGSRVYKNEVTSNTCIHCKGIYSCLYLSKKAKVYIDGLNEIDCDLFITMDQPSYIIVSERFVEACKKENITNILDKLVEVYDASEYSE